MWTPGEISCGECGKLQALQFAISLEKSRPADWNILKVNSNIVVFSIWAFGQLTKAVFWQGSKSGYSPSSIRINSFTHVNQ